MIILEKIPAVAKLLLDAALAGTTVRYRDFHALFKHDDPDLARYFEMEQAYREIAKNFTLDAASRTLACLPIYSSVMAKTGDGLPGDGFYVNFCNARPDEYKKLTNADHIRRLTRLERSKIAVDERLRVYADARDRFLDDD